MQLSKHKHILKK